MKLSQLLENYPQQSADDLDVEVQGITHDSRYVNPGDVYVCLEGLRVDGHLFAGQAVQRGAAAVVATKPLYLPVPVVYVADTRHALSYLSDQFLIIPAANCMWWG